MPPYYLDTKKNSAHRRWELGLQKGNDGAVYGSDTGQMQHRAMWDDERTWKQGRSAETEQKHKNQTHKYFG